MFRLTISSQFGIQSHVPSSAFRVIISFSVWRSKPPPLFSLAFRAVFSFWHRWHHLSLFWRSESHLQFGIQSRIFILAFDDTIFLYFGIQSHHRIFNLAFRAVFSFWHQSYHLFRLAFRAVVHFPFSIQSHIFILTSKSLFFCSTFKATSLFWRLEPHLQFGVQNLIFISISELSPFSFGD